MNKKIFLSIIPLILLVSCGSNNNGEQEGQGGQKEKNVVDYSDPGDESNSYSNHLKFYLENGDEEFVPCADPFMIQGDDGAFYAYCSNTYVTMGSHGKKLDYGPVFKSTDMVNWKWVNSVFLDQEEYALWNNGEGGAWAPSVAKIGDTYNFYYCLGQGGYYSDYTGIGVATSPTPYGPWTHYGKIFDSGEIGVKNSIDPYVFIEDGKVLMSFGSGDGIWIVELNSTGTALKNGLEDAIANKVMIGGYQMYEGNNYEASFIQKREGYYYLYLSTGSCCDGLRSTYHVVVGRSESLYGPYVGANGKPIDRSERGTTVIESHVKNGTGTGHCAILKDAKGLDWLVYHAYDPNEEGSKRNERVLYIDRLYWGSNGFPTCKDKAPTHSLVPGPYLQK